ncbi:MAG: aromatic ring-hydroxylating dioxygenase subunit alpha [Cyanobacteria bacterium J06634_5]
MSLCKSKSFNAQQYQNWYIACTAKELRRRPISRMVLGIPMVLFRGEKGRPVAFLDRCPHRNVPLSEGWLKRENGVKKTLGGEDTTGKTRLVCRYHGWQFDERGRCDQVPGLCALGHSSANPLGKEEGSSRKRDNRDAIAYRAIEQQGFVWVYPTASCDADIVKGSQPYLFPWVEQDEFSTFHWQMTADVSLANAAENFLDATHTHFVHAGLVRTQQKRRLVTVKVRRSQRSAEAVYTDEQQISGLIYRLLAPGCKEITSIGKFLLPSIAQIEYRTDKNYRLVMSLCMTPISPQQIHAYVVVTFRWGLPNWLGKWVARPLFYGAMRQDLAILQAQAKNIARFGEERFAFTPIDVLRPHIDYLLAQSDSTESCPDNGVAGRTVEKAAERAAEKVVEKTVLMEL